MKKFGPVFSIFLLFMVLLFASAIYVSSHSSHVDKSVFSLDNDELDTTRTSVNSSDALRLGSWEKGNNSSKDAGLDLENLVPVATTTQLNNHTNNNTSFAKSLRRCLEYLDSQPHWIVYMVIGVIPVVAFIAVCCFSERICNRRANCAEVEMELDGTSDTYETDVYDISISV
ncbi:uncharacterized protein LOC142346072 [Convolutriloba macropyga]|uniref:uncharacterized protein LOC142346072 n=1 Tax=Convolutriloba macropyga TaxID=536237 RepID=UPI003F51F18B